MVCPAERAALLARRLPPPADARSMEEVGAAVPPPHASRQTAPLEESSPSDSKQMQHSRSVMQTWASAISSRMWTSHAARRRASATGPQ